MATLSNIEPQGFGLYRKSDSIYRGRSNYLVSTGTACYEDDGYDETDALAIVSMLKDQIDQGQGTYFTSLLGWSCATGLQPVSQETHDKWLNQVTPDAMDEYSRPKKQARVEPKVNVARVVPKIVDAPIPRTPPKLYTLQQDWQAVEYWIRAVAFIDKIEIIRTIDSITQIAKWIRQDEPKKIRSRNPISLAQVRTILKEFEK